MYCYSTCIFVIILFITQGIATQNQQTAKSWRNVTNIVLIGSTGDLAKRYLWQGFFHLFRQETTEQNKFKFYATAREEFETGKKKIDVILADSIKCPKGELSCVEEKKAFARVTQYHRLKNDEDYNSLCQIISNNVEPEEREKGRMFYLSVPPFAYTQIAKRINSFCRHQDKHTWTRLVLEKPFGSDFTSAQELAKDLAKYFEENEIYRIDHYLGKGGVTQILDFRFSNHDLYKNLWSRDHIERVEIVLKERNDCKGRTNFYDHYGVIRDVMQNHMTELLVMVAMEMPNNRGNRTSVMQNKRRLLREIKPMNRWSGIVGQYRLYNTHYRSEKRQEKMADSQNSNTPTFAAVSVFVNNARWQGVPFVLVSGKQLDERTAYVRILFKNNVHKVHSNSVEDNKCSVRQILFNIQGERLQKPAVLLSGFLPKPKSCQPLISMENITGELFGCSGNSFDASILHDSTNAYTTLISAVYHEKKNLFVGTEDLLTSWKVWSHFLDSLNNVFPRQYDQENLDVLEFVTVGERIEFSCDNGDGSCIADGICKSVETSTNFYKQDLFRNNHLIAGTSSQIVRTLAISVIDHAHRAVSQNGVFHLALSGGTSPVMLYETLAFRAKAFPWQHTHIWMVDERCVPFTSRESNFGLIYDRLLRHVPISPFNIHPMHIMLKGGLCDANDNGAEHYEADLRRSLVNGQLDFVVLGIGADGHTASLFPHQTLLNNKDKWIGLTETGSGYKVKQRMTMTLNLLNKAKSTAFLVLGDKKQDIVKKLSSGDVDIWRYPITGIQPITRDMTWYIDNEAFGRH